MLELLSLLFILTHASDVYVWKPVERDVFINYLDLENYPVQIRTDGSDGSDESARLRFYTAEEQWSGGVVLYFTSPPQYWLTFCSDSRKNYDTTLPTETDKIWTITLRRTSSAVRVIIYCNDNEVLSWSVEDDNCEIENGFSKYWSKNFEKIYFVGADTASDFYQPGPCSAGTHRPTGQTECVPCKEGTISADIGATSCTPCDSGKQANSDKTQCVECSAGTYRDNTLTSCTKCPENSVTEQTGAASCTSCPAGTVPNDEQTQCEQSDTDGSENEEEEDCEKTYTCLSIATTAVASTCLAVTGLLLL